MSKNWILRTGLLFLGSLGSSQAHPLDLPDIVYIDVLPCNSACQSYMDWSWRKTSSMPEHSAPVESGALESPPVKPAPEKPVGYSAHSAVHQTKAAHRERSKPAVPRTAKQAAPLPPAMITRLRPAGDAAVKPEPAPTNVGTSPSADGAAETSKARTVQEQVGAATALAEQVTVASAAPVPQREPTDAGASVNSGAAEPGDTEPTVSAATGNTDNRVAVLNSSRAAAPSPPAVRLPALQVRPARHSWKARP
jgi:hypothetical protein